MPIRPEDRYRAPARTPSYCVAGDFASADAPKTLLQVNAHRSHRKTPRCHEPPMIQSPAGTWVQAVDSPRLAAQTRAVASQPPPESPASDVPPEVPAPFDLTPPSPGAPQPPRGFGVGRAIVPPPVEPSPDPPPVLFQSPKPIMFEAEVWQLYQWSRQKGFTGTPDECFAQAIKGFYLLRFGVGITAHEIDPRPLLLDLLRGFSGHTEYAA